MRAGGVAAAVRVLEARVQQANEALALERDAAAAAQKQRLYNDVGAFLMKGFSGRHWWCSYPALMTFMMRVLELHPGTDSVRELYARMALQLGACAKCVDLYHASLPGVRVELEFEYTDDSINAFFHKMAELDAERIQRVFAARPTGVEADDRALAERVSVTLYEVLSQRRLLSDFRVLRALSKWVSSPFGSAIDRLDLDILRNSSGLFHMLVSPDPGVRAWMTTVVKRIGRVELTGEAGHDRFFISVLDEWMFVLETEKFNEPAMTLGLPSTDELEHFLDVNNCAKTPTAQIMWAALDTVMQQMDENSLETMLESFDNLPDLVFNNLDEADPAKTNQQFITVISKCYKVLLRCLGHRFWRHTVHSPRIVLTLILDHCHNPAWREFVIKHMIELFPPLLVAMRPPQMYRQCMNDPKLEFYFKSRDDVIRFLIHPEHRPRSFQSSMMSIVASNTLMTIIGDCYDHRQARGQLDDDPSSSKSASKDDGELPESNSVDYSIAESANWWPCGGDKALETLWMSHILAVVTNPKHDASHVDNAALRCAMILRKHLQLARDALYMCIKDGVKEGAIASVTSGKPIVTLLFEKLCAVSPVTLIPVTVHGALFESIGGIAELLNNITSQSSLSAELQSFSNVLKTYENHIRVYFTNICEEVFVKGLINPLQFPIVAQHVSICLLSPTADMDQPMKRMLALMAASKGAEKLPSPMEAFLIVAHRKTEAFLRGVISILQTLRLYDFALPVSAPILKKIVFYWGKVFELLGNDLKKAIEGVQPQLATEHSAMAIGASSAASMQRAPVLINDFLIAIFSGLYGSQGDTLSLQVEEATRIRCLEFGISFWKFWGTHLEQDVHSVSKRATFIIAPLVACLNQKGTASEKTRAVQLLTIVLEHLVAKRTTALDESTLTVIEGAQVSVSAVDPNRGSTMPRVIKKLRQLEKSKTFFGRQFSSDAYTSSLQAPRERKPGRVKPLVDLTADDYFPNASAGSSVSGTDFSAMSSRPMSGKAAARVQARGATVDLTGVTAVSNQAAARKKHSFYSEEDFVPAVRAQQSSSSRPNSSGTRAVFSMSQVIQGMSKAHPSADRRRLQNDESSRREENPEDNEKEEDEDDEDDEEESNLQYASLYHRIKTTQKPIAVCSLLPFYRQLLQLCMPGLLTYEYLNDQKSSDRELAAPGLTFSKSAEYVNSFLPLLLEECSSDVYEGLRSCRQSGGHVMRYESEKAKEGMRCLNFSLVQVDESTKTSMNFKFTNRFVPPTTDKLFRNGDIVLLRAATNRGTASSGSSGRHDESQTRQNNSNFMGNREFIGVIMINENEKSKKRVTGGGGKRGGKDAGPVEEDIVRVLFLNDGELDSATSDRVASFEAEILNSSSLADTEWRVQPASNVVTSAREYIALRSVDLLPEHLRSTILTPNVHKSTQTDIIKMAEVLDSLRSSSSPDAIKNIDKLLKRLDKLDISLTDLRSTSIGKMVNKLRKHKDESVKQRANALKDRWTALIDQKDALEHPPRFLAPELWTSVRSQYNQSQLQSIHNVLNNYNVGVSLLQGPPGTGKTKTIMALLSGFLALKPPASALVPSLGLKAKALDTTSQTKDAQVPASTSMTLDASGPVMAFSLGSSSSSGSILRRTDAPSTSGKRTTIQSLKNASSVRSRLDQKLTNASSLSRPAASSLVVRRRVFSNPLGRAQAHRTNHLLLCAPSNGAVNELVLRIVTDGLLDSNGSPVKVRAPSVHADTSNCDWISIVRLGNPGEDASEAVAGVSLPNIIKREMEIHPKTIELRSLQDTQRKLRSSIKEFHQNAKEKSEAGGEEGGKRTSRKELAKMHAELTSVSGKVRRLRDEVFALKTKLTETILSRASIIACTLSKAGSGQFNSLKRGFDALIIDEAAQAVELSTLVPLRERVARVVLVGDPKQLPATVKSVAAARARYDRSLFERIADSGVAPSMLRVQYRMHPFLREFPSKRFYNGLLTDGPSVMERVQRTCSRIYTSTCFQPFLLYDLPNSREEDVNGSKWNRGEAQFCVQLCESMFNMCADVRMHKWSVGFVSPYREQVNALRRELSRSSSSFSSTLSVEVNTVDGFQGREKDVIIFSCVRSSHRGGIGFLRDIRRLNVAITRARFCLFVVGDVRTLVRDETWDALVRSARERKLIIHTDGAPFPEVVKRLEGSAKGRELAGHYREMHEKANRKSAGGDNGKSDNANDDSAEMKPDSKQAVKKVEQPLDEGKIAIVKSEPTAEPDNNSSNKSEKTELGNNTKMEKTEPPLGNSNAGSSSPTGTASTTSTASADIPLIASTKDSSRSELPNRSIQPLPPKRSVQPGNEDDRKRKLARVDSRDSERSSANRRREGRSYESHSDHFRDDRPGFNTYDEHPRDRTRPRSQDSRRPSSSGDRRDSRRDYGDNNYRGVSRSRDPHLSGNRRNHYGNGKTGDEKYGYSSRDDSTCQQSREEQATATASKPPPSISTKEFCMENEPARPTTQHKPRVPEAVQLANAVQRALGKRPFNGSSPRTPPSTVSPSTRCQVGYQRDRPSRYGDDGSAPSSNYSRPTGSAPIYRRVENPSSTGRPAQHKRPNNSGSDSRGAGVLGSILGSASQLASSTSRVQDKKRSNEF